MKCKLKIQHQDDGNIGVFQIFNPLFICRRTFLLPNHQEPVIIFSVILSEKEFSK